MPGFKTILFDLDGTLTDPKVGITSSVRYSLIKLGRPVPDDRILERFIGPPLAESYSGFCNLSADDCDRAITAYREYFADRGLLENTVYPGIPEMLAILESRGLRLAVATSKPTVFARQILDHFNLSDSFEYIGGSNLDNTRTKKAEVISHVLEELGLEPSGDIVMVGDREHDIIGAKAAGLPSVGVLYGYGSLEEMKACDADSVVRTVAELERELAGS